MTQHAQLDAVILQSLTVSNVGRSMLSVWRYAESHTGKLYLPSLITARLQALRKKNLIQWDSVNHWRLVKENNNDQ